MFDQVPRQSLGDLCDIHTEIEFVRQGERGQPVVADPKDMRNCLWIALQQAALGCPIIRPR